MFNYNPMYQQDNTTPDTGMIEVIPDTANQGNTPITTLPAQPLPGNTIQPPTTLPADPPAANFQPPTTLPAWVNRPSGNYPPHFPPVFPSSPVANVLQLCMNNLMYITTRNGESFWFYPTDIYQTTVNGYRWNPQPGWFPYSIPFASIRNAFCYNP